MRPTFDHERLRASQEALRFAAWVEPVLEKLPAKLAARDQLDRASTSIVLNIAEGNGKRSHADRCRFLDIARGSVVESAACLDVLVVKRRVERDVVDEGKQMLLAIVSMVAGLIARFEVKGASRELHEDGASYEAETEVENEKENEERERF